MLYSVEIGTMHWCVCWVSNLFDDHEVQRIEQNQRSVYNAAMANTHTTDSL